MFENETNLYRNGGFSFIEVIIAMAVAGLTMSIIVFGFISAAQQAEWAGYSQAAQSLAIQGIEQMRSAKWDPSATTAAGTSDQLVSSNFPMKVLKLDVPVSGNNIVYATNRFTIQTITADPPLRMMRVDCTWPFRIGGLKTYTNTIVTYRAPDQPQPR
jgi:prepilin-type N-terminal cleavage/methylation domain-containing protein